MTRAEWLAEMMAKINRNEITSREMKQIIHAYNSDLALLDHLENYFLGILKNIRKVR